MNCFNLYNFYKRLKKNDKYNVNNTKNTKTEVENSSRPSQPSLVTKKELNSRAIMNITKMVMVASFSYIICTTTFTITFILSHNNYINSFHENVFFSILSMFVFISPSIEIFLFYSFNKHYRDVFLSFIKIH